MKIVAIGSSTMPGRNGLAVVTGNCAVSWRAIHEHLGHLWYLRRTVNSMSNPPNGSHSRKYMLTPEYRQKMSEVKRGIKHTPEERARISASLKNRVFTPEHRAKLSEALKHRVYTEEMRTNMSKAQQGKPAHPNTKAALLKANKVPKSLEQCKKISERQLGENNSCWRGGISFEPYCPKFNRDLKRRIRAFFGNRCVFCGISSDGTSKKLCCHHVEYNKSACCDSKPVQFATLCLSCHTKTNHGNRQKWQDMMHRIIDEVYGGRSYYTKDEYLDLLKNGAAT